MEHVIPIIIVIVVIVFKVFKAVQEQRDESGGDGWWEEEGGSSPSQPTPNRQAPSQPAKPKPQPSQHVQEILRQLQEKAEAKQQKPAQQKVVVKQAPPPAPVEVAPKPERVTQSQPTRRYLDEGQVEAELVRKARAEADAATADVYKQSVTAAFPAAMKMAHDASRTGSDRKAIRVRASGRRNLRQAILLGEALGPPRAFDL